MGFGDYEECLAKILQTLASTTSYGHKTFIVPIIIFILHICIRPFHKRDHLGVFTLKSSQSKESPYPYCAVCLHEITVGERYRKLPKCDHCFHVECIDKWFESRCTCPLCRNHISLVYRPPREEPGLVSFLQLILQSFFRKMANSIEFHATSVSPSENPVQFFS